jgi:hypothetical protein
MWQGKSDVADWLHAGVSDANCSIEDVALTKVNKSQGPKPRGDHPEVGCPTTHKLGTPLP